MMMVMMMIECRLDRRRRRCHYLVPKCLMSNNLRFVLLSFHHPIDNIQDPIHHYWKLLKRKKDHVVQSLFVVLTERTV